MDFKYKIKGDELYIFLDFKVELSDDFLDNARKKLSKFKEEVTTFAKKIGFEGSVAKIVVQGVLIATIVISVDANSVELNEDNLDELISERLSRYKEKYELELDVNRYYLPDDSKKYGKPMVPKYIVVHNTANSASAYNEVSYLHSTANMNFLSFHYAVDEKEIWQALPDDVNGWHAGDGAGKHSYNRNSIGIEIARSTLHNELVRNEALNNAAKLIAYLIIKYDIPIENVVTHHEASGKYCPHDIFDRYGWDNFNKLVSSYL